MPPFCSDPDHEIIAYCRATGPDNVDTEKAQAWPVPCCISNRAVRPVPFHACPLAIGQTQPVACDRGSCEAAPTWYQ